MTPSTPTAVTATGRPATDPAGPTGRLATWVAKTALDDVPASVRDRAKHLVLDGIACALVGAQLPVSRIGVEGVTALDSASDSALIGWDGRATSATSAAMLNSSFIQPGVVDNSIGVGEPAHVPKPGQDRHRDDRPDPVVGGAQRNAAGLAARQHAQLAALRPVPRRSVVRAAVPYRALMAAARVRLPVRRGHRSRGCWPFRRNGLVNCGRLLQV